MNSKTIRKFVSPMENKVFMEWDSDYELSLETIDNQHRNLVSIINRLYKAHLLGNSEDIISGVILELIHYTYYHFSTEEQYFNKLEFYTKKEEHIAKHKKFIEKVLKFKAEISKNDKTKIVTLVNFLKDWLVNHILKTDKEFIN